MAKNILSQHFIKKHGEKTNGLQHASHNKMLPQGPEENAQISH